MYKVKLTDFEGPLELLLFFIKRDELDIYDIPISRILKEFMEYLHLIEELDLETAGDFLIMACTLMQIKVRMLLPREIDEKGNEIDPREELVRRLIEYMRFKEMTDYFSSLESQRRKISLRHYFEYDEKENPDGLGDLLKNITLYDLTKAFKRSIDNLPKETFHEIKKPVISTEEQMDFILNLLEKKGEIKFSEMIADMKEKIRIIITFIILLELCKNQIIILDGSEDVMNFKIIKVN